MADPTLIEKSETSESSNVSGKTCTAGRFITDSEGKKILDIAATWMGTPYELVGAKSEKGKKGDCSGTTNKIYVEAGFSYPYQTSGGFEDFSVKTNRFREINPEKTPMQSGDVLLWPGHMAIYAKFSEADPKRYTGLKKSGKDVVNDMYTAFNQRTGAPYAPYNIKVFRPDKYKVFRYYLMPGEQGCEK